MKYMIYKVTSPHRPLKTLLSHSEVHRDRLGPIGQLISSAEIHQNTENGVWGGNEFDL